ncbi:MAG TPA: hypothetical protein ENG66_00005 [Thermococcus sp.]|nr:hypothetical protein [Thermococcus sp.]
MLTLESIERTAKEGGPFEALTSDIEGLIEDIGRFSGCLGEPMLRGELESALKELLVNYKKMDVEGMTRQVRNIRAFIEGWR